MSDVVVAQLLGSFMRSRLAECLHLCEADSDPFRLWWLGFFRHRTEDRPSRLSAYHLRVMTDEPAKKTPRGGGTDLNKIAARVVGKATGTGKPKGKDDGKNPAAVALGRLGGKKGGKARAEKLTKKRRSEIAKMAARARWNKSTD